MGVAVMNYRSGVCLIVNHDSENLRLGPSCAVGSDEGGRVCDLARRGSNQIGLVPEVKKNIGRLLLQFLLDARECARVRAAGVEQCDGSVATQVDLLPAKQFHQNVT